MGGAVQVSGSQTRSPYRSDVIGSAQRFELCVRDTVAERNFGRRSCSAVAQPHANEHRSCLLTAQPDGPLVGPIAQAGAIKLEKEIPFPGRSFRQGLGRTAQTDCLKKRRDAQWL